jgi:beta-lactam-binding protein with PASTA domain
MTFQYGVTNGSNVVEAPLVVGLTQDAATAVIAGAGFVVGIVTTEASATVPAGVIVRQTPSAGTLLVAGSPVSLVISSGPPAPKPRKCTGTNRSSCS